MHGVSHASIITRACLESDIVSTAVKLEGMGGGRTDSDAEREAQLEGSNH